MKINKKMIAEKVKSEYGFTLGFSTEIMDFIFEEIKQELAKGNEVYISSFGKFFVKEAKSRVCTNLIDNQSFEIPAQKVPKFRAGKQFREHIK